MAASSVLPPEPTTPSELPAEPRPTGPRLRILVIGRLRILVVEDNRDGAAGLRLLQELLGCDVAVAYSGPEGVQAVGERRPDLVLSATGDFTSPASGLAIACKLALSGCGPNAERRPAKEAGFEYVLTKPADPAALLELLCYAPP